MIEVTDEWLMSVVKNTYINSDITRKLSEKIKIHASGEVPEFLINTRRPSEPEEIKEYRKKIYVPITENPIGKVITSLQKIRRSQDWSIQYSGEIPASVAEDETLQMYCETNYPGFSSVTNWVFAELLQRYLFDANSIVAVLLKNIPANTSEYYKPVAEIFNSEQIIDYSEDEYVVLLSADKVKYTTPYGRGFRTYYDGNIYYVLTQTHLARLMQTNRSGDLVIDYNIEHNIGILPAFKAGGLFNRRVNNENIYKSRISSMVPFLDEAAREYSDLQAEVVQHVHSEKYIYTNTECPSCKGNGICKKTVVKGEEEKIETCQCDVCLGSGHIKSVSPYGEYILNAQKMGENSLPSPPIGYVEKSVDIAKLQDERVHMHLYRALASINMEFLDEVPLNQSGLAKEVDKEELNNFVNSIAEDLVRIMDRVYFFINEFRYAKAVPNKDKRTSMLPSIPVPERFDILSSSYIMAEIKSARDSGVNAVIIKDLETEYAIKRYNADADVAKEVEAIYNIDPLYGYTLDEKDAMLNNRGITEKDYVVSCNINQLVRRAINENEGFFDLDIKGKKDIVYKYADEIIQEISAKQQISNQLNDLINGRNTEDTEYNQPITE